MSIERSMRIENKEKTHPDGGSYTCLSIGGAQRERRDDSTSHGVRGRSDVNGPGSKSIFVLDVTVEVVLVGHFFFGCKC